MTIQLAELLIDFYQEFVDHISKLSNVNEAKFYLNRKYAINGLCNFCKKMFDIDIYEDKWIEFINPTKFGYIYKTPNYCNSINEIIESLQFRIEVLKKFTL